MLTWAPLPWAFSCSRTSTGVKGSTKQCQSTCPPPVSTRPPALQPYHLVTGRSQVVVVGGNHDGGPALLLPQ